LRRFLIGAAGAAILSVCGFSGASAHGGGGGVVYVPVFMPSGGGVSYPSHNGLEANLALEIADSPPTAVEGVIKNGDVIARHVLRSTDAIVTLAPIKGDHRDIPAGTALARMEFRTPQTLAVWCDVRPIESGRIFGAREQDCFVDKAGTGRLDELWEGDSPVHFLGFGLSGVGAPAHPLADPAPYRAARPEERPTAVLAYRFCDGDEIHGPPRFAFVVEFESDGANWPLQGACRFGYWPDPTDTSKVRVDGLDLVVSPEAGGAVRFRVLNRIAAGPVAMLEPDESIHPPLDAAAQAAADIERQSRLSRPVYRPTGAAPVVQAGEVAVGQQFLSLPIEHAITGVLQVPVWRPRQTEHLEPGEAMFAVPERGASGDGLVWCAPRAKDGGGYRVICLQPGAHGYTWLGDVRPSLAPTWTSGGGWWVNGDPIVDPKPVKLPPMTLTARLAAVQPRSATDPTPIYTVEFAMEWGEGPQRVNRIDLDLPPSGRVLPVMNAVLLRLSPSPTPGRMMVEPVTGETRPSGLAASLEPLQVGP
jgi:hypothetical protein